jgi:hypothetical protein
MTTRPFLLVGVEDGHQGHFGQVQALPEQVDAHQHVEGAEPQLAQDLDPGHGVHVGVEVLDPDPLLGQVVGEVLGHLLGQGGDQHPVAVGHRPVDPLAEVVDLAGGGHDVDLGVDQAGGPDDLLHHVGAVLQLPWPRGGREQDDLAGPLDELLEPQGPVVQGRG